MRTIRNVRPRRAPVGGALPSPRRDISQQAGAHFQGAPLRAIGHANGEVVRADGHNRSLREVKQYGVGGNAPRIIHSYSRSMRAVAQQLQVGDPRREVFARPFQGSSLRPEAVIARILIPCALDPLDIGALLFRERPADHSSRPPTNHNERHGDARGDAGERPRAASDSVEQHNPRRGRDEEREYPRGRQQVKSMRDLNPRNASRPAHRSAESDDGDDDAPGDEHSP